MKSFYISPVSACLFILFLFLGTSTIQAQTTNETYRHISTRDGLTSGFVWDIMEDRNGFIWVATNSGLDKYDGYSVTSFRNDPSNESSISRGTVFSMMEDSTGKMWAGTTSGLNLTNSSEGTFRQILLPGSVEPLRLVRSILQDTDGEIWAASATGIYRIPSQDFAADTLSAKVLHTDTSGNSVSNITALALNENSNTIWAGSDSALYKVNTESMEVSEPGPFSEDVNRVLSGNIWDLHLDGNETLWISSAAGLAAWHKEEDAPTVIESLGPYDAEEFAQTTFQSLTEDANGGLWIGTGAIGAIRLDIETGNVQTYRHGVNSQSIREDDVHFVFNDSENNTWFGYHNSGISLMYSLSWNYTLEFLTDDAEPDDPINEIHTIKEDEGGNLWFTTHRGLVMKPADGSAQRSYMPNPESTSGEAQENQLITLSFAGNQIISTSHQANQIQIFNWVDETFDTINVPDSLNAILLDIAVTDDHLYLGSLNRTLVQIDRNTHEFNSINVPVREQDDGSQKPVLPLVDYEGNMLVKSFYLHELEGRFDWDSYLFDPSDLSFTLTGLQVPDGISVFQPPHVSNHQPGVVWGVFNNGLLREDFLNEESQLYFRDEAGILNDNQPNIYEDTDGYLWMAGSGGISKLDPVTETLTYFEADPNRKPSITHQPGLLSNGDLVFPGRGGYVQFNPNEMGAEEAIKNIHITELWSGSEIYNTLAETDQAYEVDYANNNISLSYLGLNYRNPNFIRYRYRLNGYDNEWNLVGTQRRIFLANLPPGQYTFQVQAAKRYGGFSDETAELNIAVLPPWWRTLPAYIFYILLLIGGGFTIDRVQRKRLIRKERERAREKELEQAKEIEKAYENLKAAQEQLVQQEKLASLGQLTAGIAHEIKNPLNFVNNFSDLSVELVQEAREEIKSVGAIHELPLQDIYDILNDIEANLRKIHEHGSRADGIVKSMLQHSRGGSDTMEPTNINGLIKEYANLAFHGMRASKNPITVDIELDLDEKIGEVPLIAEDFSRVILNLCNNSFDAMREKANGNPHETDKSVGTIHELPLQDLNYQPKLTVRTHQTENGIILEIKDNGPGILPEIKDKILQPFFTTKKGTEGTGLGLSITNDIIKAHGGKLEIESNEAGTTMKITLNQT